MAPLDPKPQTFGRLAATLAVDRTTLTANLKPPERRGLVASAAVRKTAALWVQK